MGPLRPLGAPQAIGQGRTCVVQDPVGSGLQPSLRVCVAGAWDAEVGGHQDDALLRVGVKQAQGWVSEDLGSQWEPGLSPDSQSGSGGCGPASGSSETPRGGGTGRGRAAPRIKGAVAAPGPRAAPGLL